MSRVDRLLVTGATGFVGEHLVRGFLDDGHEVGVVARDTSDTGRLDQRATVLIHDGSSEGLFDLVSRYAPIAVVHAATKFVARHQAADLADLIQANLLFGLQLLDAMGRAKIGRLVNFGTSWQHYDSQSYRPVSLYAATKQAFEDLAAYYVDACGLRMVTLKLSDSYGPGDRRAKLLPHLFKIARSGASLPMSAGAQIVNFVHVDDVVEAARVALRRVADGQGGAEAFAVAGDEQLTLRHFVERVAKVVDLSLNVEWGARPYREREVMAPWMGLRLPHWAPRVDLDSGLRRLVRERV